MIRSQFYGNIHIDHLPTLEEWMSMDEDIQVVHISSQKGSGARNIPSGYRRLNIHWRGLQYVVLQANRAFKKTGIVLEVHLVPKHQHSVHPMQALEEFINMVERQPSL